MLSKISKFGVGLGWSIISKVLKDRVSEIKDPATLKLANHFNKVGQKSVDVLTNDNPDDKLEFDVLLKEQKTETAIVGVEAARELVKDKIKDPLVRTLVDSALEEVQKALLNGTFSEADFMGNVQVAIDESPKS